MAKKKLMFVFGTRPDTIKQATVILKAKEFPEDFEVATVATAQHRQMLDDVLNVFGIKPDVDLNIMAPNQSLFYITSRILIEMEKVLKTYNPDIIIVQGDTTTTFATALAGYYAGKKIAHTEAGLRTNDKWQPFPEEINRKATSTIADYHFAPTITAKNNLIKEGYSEDKIFVTGNTVIDALYWVADKVRHLECPVGGIGEKIAKYKKMILITGHRRESFGEPFKRILSAFKKLANMFEDVCFVYPVHLNPNVQKPVAELLSGLPNFFLLPPLAYPDFIWFMQKSDFIITDSGGIQEEAPALSKPTLVTRKLTERPEALECGAVKMVGDDFSLIIDTSSKLLTDPSFYKSMAIGVSPYGDGKASERIVEILKL